MYRKPKIGRNSLCPCGSGKKYKNCCGKSSETLPTQGTGERDYLTLNRLIAYKGKVGKKREDFCKRYVEHKKKVIKNIVENLTNMVTARGETITCNKGCYYCCSQYIGGTIQEAEVIVYYLYNHNASFNHFVREYPKWRARVRENEAVFTEVRNAFQEYLSSGGQIKARQRFLAETEVYLKQNILCPFLNNNECSIYEVRPWCCASVVAIDLTPILVPRAS